MDKIDDLRVELKSMEKISKILHDLPNEASLARVSIWLSDVLRSSTSNYVQIATTEETASIEGGTNSSGQLPMKLPTPSKQVLTEPVSVKASHETLVRASVK
jgi:hypothetical protein